MVLFGVFGVVAWVIPGSLTPANTEGSSVRPLYAEQTDSVSTPCASNHTRVHTCECRCACWSVRLFKHTLMSLLALRGYVFLFFLDVSVSSGILCFTSLLCSFPNTVILLTGFTSLSFFRCSFVSFSPLIGSLLGSVLL